jgi:DNA-binding transcriptional ArsR family regulator
MLATTSALLHKGHQAFYDLGRAWFTRVSREIPETYALLQAFAGGSMMIWDHIYGLAAKASPSHDISSFVEYVARMDAQELRLALLGRHYRNMQRKVGIERIEDAAAGNVTAQRDMLRLAWPEETAWQTGIREILKNPAGQTQQALVELLGALGRDLRAYIEPTLPALEADAAEKQAAQRAGTPALDLVKAAIDTSWTPTADITAVVLVPSFVIRPQVYYFEFDDQMLFQYPVSDRHAEAVGLGPPDRLVRMAAALGDRRRLRILEALKGHGMTVKELSQELGLPRSTLRHHMGILFGAGLVRPMQSGSGFNGMQLREEAVTDLAEMVEKFLRS